MERREGRWREPQEYVEYILSDKITVVAQEAGGDNRWGIYLVNTHHFRIVVQNIPKAQAIFGAATVAKALEQYMTMMT